MVVDRAREVKELETGKFSTVHIEHSAVLEVVYLTRLARSHFRGLVLFIYGNTTFENLRKERVGGERDLAADVRKTKNFVQHNLTTRWEME